ncbi:collagen binding domain-containing protein [Chloroflexota bacterium]
MSPCTPLDSWGGYVSLNAWVDFNIDGDWADDSEHIISESLSAGIHTLPFPVPAGADLGGTYARFRLSTENITSPTGEAPDGEVEDYKVEIDCLGEIKIEKKNAAGTENLTGATFEVNPDPRDGAGTLIIKDGDAIDESLSATDGIILIKDVPCDDYTVEETIPPDGYLLDDLDNPQGPKEVTNGETTTFTFYNKKEIEPPRDFGDAPEEPGYNYCTLLARSGAWHFIDSDIYLGDSVDAESDGQPDPDALGDDNDGNDDEDGVIFPPQLSRGSTANVTVTSSVSGNLSAWLDFNRNRNWEPDEQIFTDKSLISGPNVLSFDVPVGARLGDTFARFRFSTVGGLSYNGTAPDGEVEDYEVIIVGEFVGGQVFQEDMLEVVMPFLWLLFVGTSAGLVARWRITRYRRLT